ncbi:MAG: thioredoxin domain-containing protein [Caulobacteraceae bacterium]
MRAFTQIVTGMVLALTLVACNKTTSAVTDDDMSLGNAQAKVTVIEYGSASCAHCARWNNDVFAAFKARFIDTGRVHYVFREFLTEPRAMAAAGFLTARCAGRDKYFQVLDAVYHAQEEMFTTQDMRGPLLRIAQGVGLTEAQFNACVSDQAATKALNDRVEKYARDANITATPTFVINGKVNAGEMSMEQLEAAISAAEIAAGVTPPPAPAAAAPAAPTAGAPAATPAAAPAAATPPAAPAAPAPAAPAAK